MKIDCRKKQKNPKREKTIILKIIKVKSENYKRKSNSLLIK